MSVTRWDYSKSKSNYHFDPTRNEDDAPPFRILGRVQEDLQTEFEGLLKIEKAIANTAFHSWRRIPHGTANISRSVRATLQVTGLVTAQTRQIIENGLKELVVA